MVRSLIHDPFFRDFSPFTVGFDNVFKHLEAVRDLPQDGYPPYNIKRNDDESFEIELAVAGFKEDDLDVTLNPASSDGPATLVVKGEIKNGDKSDFDHRGLASRKFVRNFSLADNVEVKGVSLSYGLLKIDLLKVIPEDEKPIKFKIK